MCVCRVPRVTGLFLEQDHQQTEIGNLYPPTKFVSLSKHSIFLLLLNERAKEDGNRCSSQSVRTRGRGVKVSSTGNGVVRRKGYVYYRGAQTPWFLKPLDYYYYRNSYSECSDYVADSIFVTWWNFDRGITSAEIGRFCGI